MRLNEILCVKSIEVRAVFGAWMKTHSVEAGEHDTGTMGPN